MKKLLLLALSVFISGFVFSQGSFELSNDDGPIEDHGTILAIGDPATTKLFPTFI